MDLLIILRIVEYMKLRVEDRTGLAEVDGTLIMQVVNNLSPGSSLGMAMGIKSESKEDLQVGDVYNIGQAGAAGRGSSAHGQNFNQIWISGQNEIDLNRLSQELGRLRTEARRSSSGTPEEDIVLSELAKAEVAASKKDGPSAMEHLSHAGGWALEIGQRIGVEVAVKAIQAAMGVG